MTTLLAHLNETRPALRYGMAAAFTLLTTILLLQSSANPIIGPAAPEGPPDLPREILLTAGHLCTFGGLVLIWTWALVTHISVRAALMRVVPVVLLYGVLTELLQGSVPDRTTSLADLAANTFGALAMAWIIHKRAAK